MKADIANSLSARCARARVYSHTYEHGETIARVERHEGTRSRLRSNKAERKWTEPVEKVVFLKKQAEFRMKEEEMQTKVHLFCRVESRSRKRIGVFSVKARGKKLISLK